MMHWQASCVAHCTQFEIYLGNPNALVDAEEDYVVVEIFVS